MESFETMDKFEVFPNPLRQGENLFVHSFSNMLPVKVKISDLRGNEKLHFTLRKFSVSMQVNLPLGSYFITLAHGSIYEEKKILVVY